MDLESLIRELRAFQAECQERMRTIVDEVQTRDDARLSESEDAEFTQLDEWERSADSQATEAQTRLDRIRGFAEIPAAVESEDRQVETFNVNTRTSSPFDDLAELERFERLGSDDLRARAETVIESHLPSEIADSVREAATATVSRQSTKHYDSDLVRAHVIASSSPKYIEAFDQMVRTNGQVVDPILLNRAALSLTAANGGYLVPQFLDPTIVLTNDGTENDIRRISGQVSITVDQWDGVTSAGVSAEWLGEGSEAADATPTFVAPTITAEKAAAYMFGSYEVLADSGFDEVGMLFMDAKDRLEATAFTTGTGSDQPYGVVTQLSGTGPVVNGTSGDAGAADFVAADVYEVDDNLAPRWRRNANWLTSHSFANTIRQLGTSDTYHAFWVAFGGATPPQLIGYDVAYAEDMDSTIVSGSNDYPLILGDFRAGYKIVDRVGMSIAYNPLVVGGNQRPTGQAGWFAFWRVGADVITSNAFKTLKL